jgi:hypothetical protein
MMIEEINFSIKSATADELIVMLQPVGWSYPDAALISIY